MTTTRLRIRSAINFADQYIRHFNNEGELSVLDRNSADFVFDKTEVGNDQVRFNSTNANINPPKFLRHKNFRLLLEEDDQSQQFKDDSTFLRTQPQVVPSSNGVFVSYSTVNTNFATRVIRHKDFHLFVDEFSDDQAKQDATFAEEVV